MSHTPAAVNELNGGEQRKYIFPNGYGASVICGPDSYGGRDGLFELAVIGPDGNITYDTPITDNGFGWLTEPQVQDILTRISEIGDEQ